MSLVVLRGTDRTTGEVFLGCLACHGGDVPCQLHACKRCGGDGLVCPVCRGDRWVHLDVDVTHPQFGQAVACEVCMVRGLFEPTRERGAIKAYLGRWRRECVVAGGK